jgi:hypothetical protein
MDTTVRAKSNTDLAALADSIRGLHARVAASEQNALNIAQDAGDKLIVVEDSKLVPHGTWATFVKGCGMNERTARRYMQLARSGGAIEEAKRSRKTVLSIATALRLISKKTDPNPKKDSSKSNKGNTSVPKLATLALAWADAPLQERRKFIDDVVGLTSLKEAIPREWQHQADQEQLFGLLVPPKAEKKVIGLIKKVLTAPEPIAANALRSMVRELRELMAKAHFKPDELVGLQFARAEMPAEPSEEITGTPEPSEAMPGRDLHLHPEIILAAAADAAVTKH